MIDDRSIWRVRRVHDRDDKMAFTRNLTNAIQMKHIWNNRHDTVFVGSFRTKTGAWSFWTGRMVTWAGTGDTFLKLTSRRTTLPIAVRPKSISVTSAITCGYLKATIDQGPTTPLLSHAYEL